MWGGLRHENVSDLEISAGEDRELRAWERDVANVVDGVLDGGSEALSRFRDKIEDERESMHPRFSSFKEHVADEAARLKWFRSTGAISLVSCDRGLRPGRSAPRVPRSPGLATRATRATRTSCSSGSARVSSRTARSASARSSSTGAHGSGEARGG